MVSAGRVLVLFKGDYDNAVQYQPMDGVAYQGSTYVCKQTTIGNVPTNTTYWQIMARGVADASGLDYDNSESGLDADNVQDAIDELNGNLDEWCTASAVVAKGSINVTDANALFKNGIYWCHRTDVTTDNLPEINTYGILQVFNNNASASTSTEPIGVVVQIWNALPGTSASAMKIYYRMRANNAWGKWFKIEASAVE